MDPTRQLPEDLLLDIFRRLPPPSLAVSRCVCKAWCAVVDDHRRDLLKLWLEGIFLELHEYATSPDRGQEFPIPVLFSRPSTGRKIPADVGYPYPDNNTSSLHDYAGYPDNNTSSPHDDYKRVILDSCNGLLLLRNHRVVNPATRQWAQVPQMSRSSCLITDCNRCSYSRYLVFDPTVSPHYEVFSVPEIPDNLSAGHIGKHDCKVSAMEWPPTPYIMDVFSSKTGEWEERSFVREGNAAGTIDDCNAYRLYQSAACWHGSLYVMCEYDFILRIKLSNNTYQVIELPKEEKGSHERRLGKSEKGVYCAYRCARDVFHIWFLDESRGQTEWVFKSDINFKPVPWCSHNFVRGSWILQAYDDYETRVLEEHSEWDPDHKGVISIEHWVGTHSSGIYDFLGFHPDKEIAILTSNLDVIAYHLNTCKVRHLGHIGLAENEVQASFPYTPCWMGPLPGASEHMI